MRYILIMITILGLLSCEETGQDILEIELTNTSWSIVKAELIENGDVVTTLSPNPDLANQILSFRENGLIEISDDLSGCGQWTIKNNNLRFRIWYGQIVQHLCSEDIFANVFICDNTVELTSDETLTIEGLCGAFDYFYYLSNWFDIRDSTSYGKTAMKTYFVKTRDFQPLPQQSCCGKL